MLAAPAQQTSTSPVTSRFQRVDVDLHGRLMLPDRTEHECHVTQMSPGTAKLRTSGEGSVGERVIAYIDHIGRIVGTITKTNPSGFSIEFDLSAKKRERVSARLTWLTNKHELNLPEDRRHERLVPKRQINTLSLGDGREYSCQILDLSLSGAALEIAVRPAIGTPVTLGNLRGRIVRHFDDGVAIEFAHVQQRGTFDTFFS